MMGHKELLEEYKKLGNSKQHFENVEISQIFMDIMEGNNEDEKIEKDLTTKKMRSVVTKKVPSLSKQGQKIGESVELTNLQRRRLEDAEVEEFVRGLVYEDSKE